MKITLPKNTRHNPVAKYSQQLRLWGGVHTKKHKALRKADKQSMIKNYRHCDDDFIV